MKLEEQVLSIEQAKHLQELGLDMSDAALCWAREITCKDLFVGINDDEIGMGCEDVVPTYTLYEVLDKLPKEIEVDGRTYPLIIIYQNDEDFCFSYSKGKDTVVVSFTKTIFETAYNLLCWILENGYLEEESK